MIGSWRTKPKRVISRKLVAKAVVALAGLGLVVASRVCATETLTYSYDALGRLTASVHTGSVNNGQQTTYALDPAGNRTNSTTTGAAP